MPASDDCYRDPLRVADAPDSLDGPVVAIATRPEEALEPRGMTHVPQRKGGRGYMRWRVKHGLSPWARWHADTAQSGSSNSWHVALPLLLKPVPMFELHRVNHLGVISVWRSPARRWRMYLSDQGRRMSVALHTDSLVRPMQHSGVRIQERLV